VRVEQGKHTKIIKVKSRIGIQGNEAAAQLAREAIDSSQCLTTWHGDTGNGGLKDMFWPTKIVQTATQDCSAVSWQVGNLSNDVKITVAPLCQTGLTNTTIYVKAWRELQAHTLSEASNAFFNSPDVTLLRRRTLSRPEMGSSGTSNLRSNTEQPILRDKALQDTRCPFCNDADSRAYLRSCTQSEGKKVYIPRLDKAMRLIMKEIQSGSLGKFYCTADVGLGSTKQCGSL